MVARSVKLAGVLGILILLVAACAPLFPKGSTLTVTALGPLVTVSWPAATEVDAGQSVASYQVDVNGTAVATIAAPATSCVLTGLAASTTYTISVTSRDTANEWSGAYVGDLADDGRLSESYTTPPGAGGGTTLGCVPTTDTDGDRLPNALETNTGAYLNAGDTGTNPFVADTDGDGISDGDETLGSPAGLNLPAMGTTPTKKNILMEFDWFDDNSEPAFCGPHSHRPSGGAISRVVSAFAGSPLTNPDGTTGIAIIADYGQGGAFTGGNLVPDADGDIDGGVGSADFSAAKAANFAANRNGYFHYNLNLHHFNAEMNGGQAEIDGDDLIVSLGCNYHYDPYVSSLIMHELGHNLGLRHGGNVDTNYKPSYNSIMNYLYGYGVDTTCSGVGWQAGSPGDGVLDFSHGTRATLDEAALLETNGVCGGVDIDWNGNSVIDNVAVAADLNGDGNSIGVHSDFNDWANITFHGIDDANASSRTKPEIITEDPLPPMTSVQDQPEVNRD